MGFIFIESMSPHFKINGNSHEKWMMFSHSDELSKSVASFIKEWNGPTNLFSFKTSGSTGNPKIILIPRSSLEHSAKTTGHFFELNAGDSILLCLPVEFIAGRMMLIRAMVLGLNLHLSNPEIKEIIRNKCKYRFCAMTPLQVSKILDSDIGFFDDVEKLIIGGGQINNTLENRLIELKTHCFATYGMTETASHIALLEISKNGNEVFTALPGVMFSANENNQLIIDAPKWGVHNLLSNDIVRLVSKSEFEWKGRIDNVINTGGVKIYPENIENLLNKELDSYFFITSVYDKLLENKVIMIVEGGARNINFSSLSKFEKPKDIYFLPKFEFTKTGKIDRNKTLELVQMNLK